MDGIFDQLKALQPFSIPISLFALAIAALGYRRKSGTLIRGSFCVTGSRACNDKYVSEILLENLKDRAVTIYAIYLRLGHNYYIEIEDLAEKPLILRPFETYRQSFGPIEFYGVSIQRVVLNKLFDNKTVRKQLVLATGDGKYFVPSYIPRWNPIAESFDNHMTAVVRPIISSLKDQTLGGNIKFVVEIVGVEGREEIIPIHPRDHEIHIFRRFLLTPESLESKPALESFLRAQKRLGKFSFKKMTVYDLDEWRAQAHDVYRGPTIEAEHHNAFTYYVLGRLATLFSDWKLRRENAAMQKRGDA